MNGKGSRPGSHRVNLISVTPAYSGDASDHSDPATRETFPILQIEKGNRQVSLAGRQLNLTRLEFDLLRVLSEYPDEVCTLPFLVREVWGYTWFGGTHFLETHIGRLRSKLGESAREPRFIRTERGVGYRFCSGVEQHHMHILIYDDELTLISVRPALIPLLGWPHDVILGTRFLLSNYLFLGGLSSDLVIKWSQGMLELGPSFGPVLMHAADSQGDRHVASAMLFLQSGEDGRFAGLEVHLLFDAGRAALAGVWPEGADTAQCAIPA